MSTLVIPDLDLSWPTLGEQICEWLERWLVHGPGDLRGQPYRLDDEKRALIYRMYELDPKTGRRRFKRCCVSLRKGSAKTELSAAIAAAELHPTAPVRCAGFDGAGNPIGVGVRDPFIPMVAYTAEQSEELAYYALYVMIAEGPLADDFDIGLTRIMRKSGDGKAVPLATAPDSRDGARTTFQVFDETHRFTLPRLRQAHQTMLANLLENAARYAPDAVTRVSASLGPDGSVRVRVEDAGPGVPTESLPRLFEKFYRVPRHGEGARRGIGIGLGVVQGLAEAMGGEVAASASPLGGLAVDIFLQRAPEPPGEGEEVTT
jgi:anti-sigma regulatory factor (Ser/Thr protein kinase)